MKSTSMFIPITFSVHFGGGLCGTLLGPIFAENGLKRNGKYIGGIVYGGSSWAWKVEINLNYKEINLK